VTPAFTHIAGILVAVLGGPAVGVERQRSGHAAGPEARLGGVRAFTLLAGVAGIAGYAVALGHEGLGAVVAAGALAFIVTAYVVASRRDIDATTEVAALVVVAAGIVAGTGQLGLAAGIIAITVLFLAEKTRLHGWVARRPCSFRSCSPACTSRDNGSGTPVCSGPASCWG
jgi:MgtC family